MSVKSWCERCGKELEQGEVRYLVTVHATAEFDGDKPTTGDLNDLEAFMRRMDDGPLAKGEHDVHESKGFVLCSGCKGAFMAHPLGQEKDAAPAPDEGDEEGRLH